MIDKLLDKLDQYKIGAKYKFRALKVYCSTEWMANSTKKYRQVFDKAEVDYIRAEFSFYNKLFDEVEWKASIRIKAIQIKGTKRKDVCNQIVNETIRPDQNIFYLHKGWGTDKVGGFWKKGKYVWEAYIDEQLVSSQNFYITEVGKVISDNNPFFNLESVKLFSGPYDGWSVKNRKYLKTFDRNETQYLWVEVKLKNKVVDAWQCELFINHYDHAGQFKAQITSFKQIEEGKKNNVYTFDEGWGSREGGTWKDARYTVEIVFMDTLIAVIPFDVGDEDIEGDIEVITSPEHRSTETKADEGIEDSDETMDDVINHLNGLIGLGEIKQKIKDHISYIDFLQLRQERGFEDDEPLKIHSVFTGNPGTGKTTVVKLLGKIYHHMGLLSEGHVHEVDRVDLVGEFIGQTAPKVKEALDEARGGILFIDEAYMLARKDGDSKDFGKEVIEVLLKEMSEGDNDIAIMLAGYPDEMKTLLDSNPGLRSRVNYYFHFDDYSPDELFDISIYASDKRAVVINDEAKKYVKKLILEAYRNRDKMFGNARFSYSVVDEGKMNLGLRIMQHPNVQKITNEELSEITLADVKKIDTGKHKKKIEIAMDEDLLREALHELNALVGINNIKDNVNDLVKLVRYYRETGKDVLNSFSLHTVFVGNPGTGKTTVSRIMGKIYKALGLLERGHIIECDREGLVAGFIGQTAIKTKERIEEARGGVLFIDEAYSLAEGSPHSYGNEAIEVLLKNMEDMRGELAVIVAGYPDNMENFLKANPGLKSRFDRTFFFNDFNDSELYKIAVFMFSQEGLTVDRRANEYLKKHLKELHIKRDKYFGNARAVRKIVQEAVKNQHLRMALTPAAKRTEKMLETLTYNDIKEVISEEFKKVAIGFRR